MTIKHDPYVSPAVEAHRAALEHGAEFERMKAEVRELRAALAEKTRVSDKLMEVIETNQAIDEEHCAELDATKAALERARALLAEVYDESPCRLDHHGYCQEHIGALISPCWMRRAEALLAAGSGGAA